MASKAKIRPYRLTQTASASVNLNNFTMSEALRGVAQWLDEHEGASLAGVTQNYGPGDEDSYVEFFFDQVDDSDLN